MTGIRVGIFVSLVLTERFFVVLPQFAPKTVSFVG